MELDEWTIEEGSIGKEKDSENERVRLKCKKKTLQNVCKTQCVFGSMGIKKMNRFRLFRYSSEGKAPDKSVQFRFFLFEAYREREGRTERNRLPNSLAFARIYMCKIIWCITGYKYNFLALPEHNCTVCLCERGIFEKKNIKKYIILSAHAGVFFFFICLCRVLHRYFPHFRYLVSCTISVDM